MTATPPAIATRNGMDAIALRAPGAIAVRACVVIALATALSGCFTSASNTGPQTTETTPSDYRQRHPIAIREGERTVNIFVGRGRGALAAAQRADVLSFAQIWRREATGGVIIEVPTGTDNQLAASDSVREIRSLLIAAGVPAEGIAVTPYQPSSPGKLATVKLKYPKLVAEAGPCGLWPNDIGPSMDRAFNENKPYWNLGCASQRNLAAMVDNPADLVQPRGESDTYTPRRTYVVDKYRRGEDTSTNYRNVNNGKISDVGK